MKSLGICLGSSTISIVEVLGENNKIQVMNSESMIHEGNISDKFISLLEKYKPDKNTKITVTGGKFKDNVFLTKISESLASEYALEYENIDKDYNILVSIGGETTIAYEIDDNHHIKNIHIGNKCASGTGEFFLQQIHRMNLTSQEALKIGANSPIHPISGRCSVFCKSDCTHALNKGEPIGNVVAGLCKMMSEKILELISNVKKKNVILVGGVTKNSLVINHLRTYVSKLYIPDSATYFEALGSAIYALKHDTIPFPGLDSVYSYGESSFEFLQPLSDFHDDVEFKTISTENIKDGTKYILGIDVGSTTTKAILLNKETNAIAGKTYLRTNGNPILAARNCYKELYKIIGDKNIKIVGLGVTGSGRKIVGLHALTDSILNEIIAHAEAGVFFDSDVDTIFEIGGQDAKYTYLINGVPVDYAMNEACSAGTGSFLEESALETLNIKMENIGDLALKAKNPPNFSDQCAAFIGSDIKLAGQEGIDKKDIIAGLVYSICMNYKNRVKGNRKIGSKIFMQGGVCYNKAVPIAMAALTGQKIIVPPEPGLMGAFGAALEVKKRQQNETITEKEYNLKELIERDTEYGKPFICNGGKEKCDRKCEIITIKMDGKIYPFGGACNKYYNQLHHLNIDTAKFDFVKNRETLLLQKSELNKNINPKIRIGLNLSFFNHTYLPFYKNFFEKLDMEVILPKRSLLSGKEKAQSSFCYPMILAHGYFQELINLKPDYIFMPHIIQLETENKKNLPKTGNKKSCVFVQGEPYTLKQAFKGDFDEDKLLIPILDFSRGIFKEKKTLVNFISEQFKQNKKKVSLAFDEALEIQYSAFEEMKNLGRNILKRLDDNPQEICIVLFGRPYNSFTESANMGIPRKFASQGITIIPYDFLAYEDESYDFFMHWGTGDMILKAARIVKKHPQLFGTFITNFSCGPDSFIVELFRHEMKNKPSLTLEIDSHTADAGINTRIEAFIDVINFYKKITDKKLRNSLKNTHPNFTPAWLEGEGFASKIHLSDGSIIKGTDYDKYVFLLPSMSLFIMKPVIAYLRSKGINAHMVPATNSESLKLGRSQTSNKECLPQTLLLGNIISYLKYHHETGKPIMYLHATDTSPCRLEQYYNTFKLFIEKNEIQNFVVTRLDDRDGWSGFGVNHLIKIFQSLILGEIFEDISVAMKVIAKDPKKALEILDLEFEKVVKNFAGQDTISFEDRLVKVAKNISEIARKHDIEDVPKVTLIGEIYVRNDPFSRRKLEDRLAKHGIVTKITPFAEVLSYADYCLLNDYTEMDLNIFQKSGILLQNKVKNRMEKKLKTIFANCGFYNAEFINIKKVIASSKKLISPYLRGEVSITVGGFYKSIIDESAGVISIGPFACLPSRLSEALIKPNNSITDKISIVGKNEQLKILQKKGVDTLPFLSIETDGNPFTQVIESQLEIFISQVKRFHEKIRNISVDEEGK